jgi:glutamate dehydrogenase
VLQHSPQEDSASPLILAWESQRPFQLQRSRQLLSELAGSTAPDLAMLSVALRELRGLI